MKILLTTIVAIVGILFGWARWQERTAVFFPTTGLSEDPGRVDLPFEDVSFESTDGVKLHGWYIQGRFPVTVLWLHGNAGNIADRLDILKEMTAHLGVSSFIFDFRGYGISEGRPSEKGLYRDAEAAYRWLTENKGVDPDQIVHYGHSLGTTLAVDLALGAGKDAAGVVLESPFTSAKEMARMLYGGLPVDWLLSLKLDNIGRVGGLAMPVMVIHGEADTTIPFAMGRRVFDAAPEPKRLLAVSGCEHSDCYIVGGESYWEAWREFIELVQNPKPATP